MAKRMTDLSQIPTADLLTNEDTNMTTTNDDLINALSRTLEALTVYAESPLTRRLYDSSYSTTHARPSAIAALQAAGGYRGDWVSLCCEVNNGTRLNYLGVVTGQFEVAA